MCMQVMVYTGKDGSIDVITPSSALNMTVRVMNRDSASVVVEAVTIQELVKGYLNKMKMAEVRAKRGKKK